MGKDKKVKKDKKEKKSKKDEKKKLSKEDKKKLKAEKKTKKDKQKSTVASSSTQSLSDDSFGAKVRECTTQARSGAFGQEAKTAAEEWATAGKQEGLQIWRVEKFHIVPWPKEEYGKFYNGDSYMVLKTIKQGNTFKWDIHFWLGENTSQDEAGTAAYKTVELDDQLGGAPVQHREVQDYESDLFLSYFQPSIQILRGGVESGFNHVKPEEFETRLLHLKGKTTVHVKQVSVDSDSLNSGDVFVLDAGLKLFHWNGKAAGIREKNKGGELARAIQTERKGHPKIITLEEGQEDADFWELLGGKGPVASAAEGGDDFEAEKASKASRALFQLSDASGTLQFQEKAKGSNITKAMFNTKDVFIFDSGFEIFVWIGKGASANEKKAALPHAQSYLTKYNRPAYLPITRVIEAGENESFLAALDK
jgi:gelsolin